MMETNVPMSKRILFGSLSVTLWHQTYSILIFPFIIANRSNERLVELVSEMMRKMEAEVRI